MKLISILEGHWAVADINYPNSLAPKNTGTKSLSFLLHPEDRRTFFKKKKKAPFKS
jgi:hypothetical protein